MPRPPRCRRICGAPQVDTFCPNGCENTEPILLTLDEYEAIRLVDLEQQTHEQCAAQMDISRSTVQEIYESARRKIAACLVHGKPLHITGGNYRICGGQEAAHCGRCCQMQRANTEKSNKNCKGDSIMKNCSPPMKTVKSFSISAIPNSSSFMKLRTAKSRMRKLLIPTAAVTAHWQAF